MIRVGDTASVSKRIAPGDMAAFASLSGQPVADTLPLPVVFSLFSYLLGERLPGRGTNYLKQSAELHYPLPVDSVLTATVTVTRLRPDKRLVDLRTECCDDAGRVCCSGRALVLAAHAFED